MLPTADLQRQFSRRDLCFFLFLAASIALCWKTLRSLLSFSLTHDYASHIILIIPVSAFLICQHRRQIFSTVRSAILPGSILFLAGMILWWFAPKFASSSLHGNELTVAVLGIVLIWISGFLFFYGTNSFVRGRFALLFLLLLVPIPEVAIERITFFLQAGSADVAYGLLRLFSIPVLKQGFILRLPTLDIEVAKQCSGIRSSLALLTTVLIVSEFFLRSFSRKLILVLSILPILIFKNGVRIVAVCLLSVYVNRSFLHGWLHTSGGILFYLLGLLVLIPVLATLRKSEDRIVGRAPAPRIVLSSPLPKNVDRA